MRTDLLNNVGGVDITSAWTTFTPTISGDGGSGGTVDGVSARYQKIGSVVFFNMYCRLAGKGSLTGTIYISLPKFPSGGTNLPQFLNGGIYTIGDIALSLGLGVPTINSGATSQIKFTNLFGVSDLQWSDILTGDYFIVSGFYYSL